MQIDLAEKFESSRVDHINFVVNFLVISNFALNNRRVINNALIIYLRRINLRVLQISIQVIQFVQIEAVSLICDQVKQKQFLWLVHPVRIRIALYQIADQSEIGLLKVEMRIESVLVGLIEVLN